MSNLLGVIKAVIGQVYVVEADGSQRLLKEGDRIYSGEEIVTGASGAVSVSLPDGKTMDLGRNSHWSEHGLNAVSTAEHDTQDVASLQKSIADGADPTQALEATAAGNEAPVQIEGGGGGHTLVQLDLTGQIIDPTAGFKTVGLGSPTWELNLPENGLADAGAPPVLPPLVNIDDFAGNDGFINKNEINHTNISGTSNQNHITLTFTDSQKNTITIDVPVNNGHWTLQPDLSGLVEGEINVTATATDVSGRSAYSTTDAVIDVTDLHDNITIDNVTPDNVININESHEAQTSVHGTVSGDAKIGDAITLTVDGKEYHDVVIDLGNGNLGYRINVSTQGLLANPNIHATVTSTDEAGNTTQASSDHTVAIDTNVSADITIHQISGDDILNTAESQQPTTTISGTVGGDARVHDVVTLTVNGHEFTGTVQPMPNGQLGYAIDVNTADLANGQQVHASITTTDGAGNTATATADHSVSLDYVATADITIHQIAVDDIINATESQQLTTRVTGTVGGDARVHDVVTLTVNGHEFTGTVQPMPDGHLGYAIDVNTADLANGQQVHASITTTDYAGNTATATADHAVSLDYVATADITIHQIAVDDIINATESQQLTTRVTGTVGGDARVHDVVTLTVNGHEFTGTVQPMPDGQLGYSIPVNTADLANGQQVHASITTTDYAGNTATATADHAVSVDYVATADITIHQIAVDDIINATESQQLTTRVTGTVGGDARVHDVVTLTVNGHEFTGTVQPMPDGQLGYSIPVNTADLANGQQVHASITTTDYAGNTATATADHSVSLDYVATADITIHQIAVDDIINATESQQLTTRVTGTVGGDARVHDVVTLTVNGHEFTGTVQPMPDGQLGYSIPVNTADLANGQQVHASITTTDYAGNTATATADHGVSVDYVATADITIHQIAVDDIINATESQQLTTRVTGTVGGDARVHDVVTLTVNGHEFTGTVQPTPDGHLGYAIDVDTADLANGQQVHATITTTDGAGNTATATADHSVSLDYVATADITIHQIAVDDIINATESQQQTTNVTGTVGGDARVHDVVTLTVNGHEFTGTVQPMPDGQLGYSIPVNTADLANGQQVHASITTTDYAGNTATATADHSVSLDYVATADITIHQIAVDDIINATESQQLTTRVTGTVGGDARVHDVVTLTVNGHEFTGTVQPMPDGQLGYSIPVNTADLANGQQVHASITTTDYAGNTATATADHGVSVDYVATADITIHQIAVDDIINATESQQLTTRVTGTVGGDARVHDVVTLTVNGHEFTGTVQPMPDGHLGYAIDVNTADLANGQQVHASITTTDYAGNTATATADHGVSVDYVATADITIHQIAVDDIINATESQQLTTRVTGTVGGDARVHDVVTLTVNGHEFTGTVQPTPDGHLGYAIDVDTADLANGQQVHATITTTDGAGNTATATADHSVSLDYVATADITIHQIAVDDIINATESQQQTTNVTGTVGGDARVHDVVTLTVNGHEFTGTVQPMPDGQLGYSIPVNTADLANGQQVHASITTTDYAGNTATATADHSVSLDYVATADITIHQIAVDDIINATESQQLTTRVTGTVGGDARVHDVVTLTVNGHEFTGTVQPMPDGQLGYSIPVNTADLANGQQVHASITTTDYAGNTATATADHGVSVDYVATADITIHQIAVDDIINATESQQLTTRVTGTVGGDARVHDVVTLTVNGHEFTGTVQPMPDGHLGYAIDVNTADLANGQQVHASITTTDYAGNTATATADHGVSVDYVATADITIHQIAVDDIINATESQQQTTNVTGTVGGDARVHDVVTLTVNGHEFTGTVQPMPDGHLGYSIPVNTADLANGQQVHATITTTDGAGNTATATADHSVSLDYVATADITIHQIAVDDIINATESQQQTTNVTGTVGGDARVHDVVTLTVNGHEFTGTVQPMPDGQLGYSIPVNTADLANGQQVHASITTTDYAGNTATATADHSVSLDYVATADITIHQIAVDDIINATESQQLTTRVTGTVGGDARVHDVVTLTVNGHEFTGTVQPMPDGQLGYSIPVNTADLANGQQVHASITTTDYAGNTATATADHGVSVDYVATADITIHQIAVDDIINATESQQLTTRVTGTVGGDARVHDVVTLTVNGHEFTGTVQPMPDGHLGYAIDVNTADLANGQQVHASITTTDYAGNTATATTEHAVSVDYVATADITIHQIAVDDIINATESQQLTTRVTGTVGGDARVHDVVTLTVNGHEFTGTVQPTPDGHLGYAIDVNTADLANGQQVHASITTTDYAGNTATATADHSVSLDYVATADITIHQIAVDDIINATESQQQTTTVTGTVGGDARVHDVVTLTVNGHEFTGTVQPMPDGQLGYSIPVNTADLANGQQVHASITTTDYAGNTATATADHSVSLDYVATADITIHQIAVDDIINATESQQLTTRVTGTVGGDARVHDVVTLTVNGHEFTGTVQPMPDGQLGYSIPVNTADLANGQQVHASITTTDYAGNTATATADHGVSVDYVATADITIHQIAVDDIINATESQQLTTRVTGTVGGDARVHDVVTLTVNGHEFTGTVQPMPDGQLGYSIPVNTADLANGQQVHASITTTDYAGNTATATTEHAVSVDYVATADITIHQIAVDDIINATESQQLTTRVTGTVGGDARVHDVVTLTVNGHEFTGTVQPMPNGQLGYSIPVNTADLANGQQVHASITTTDYAGNTATATADHGVSVDYVATADITINQIAGDDIINAAESQQQTTNVTGTVGGDARVHDVVTLTVNGHEFTGTVQPLPDGQLGYSIPVNTADLANGQQVHASITTTDYAGNTATATADHTVTPDYVAEATITIDDITTDNVLNHTELNNLTQSITGTVGGDAKVGDVVDLNFNGTHVYGKVEEFGNHQLGYKIDVNSSIFGDNNVILNKDVNFTASVTSQDNAQNKVTVTTDHTVHVDNHAYNGVSINAVAGDNIVSHAESQREVFITGQVSGKDAQVGDDVEVLVQGTTYTGKVVADSNGHLYYKVPVPAGALTEGNTSAQVTVTSHDKVGNEAVATQTHNFSVDLHADATINIHELTAGSVLNHDELDTPKQLITGDVGGDARIGDKVSIEINGHFYGGKVIDLGNGNLGYQIPVDSSAFGDNHQKLDSNVKIIANVTSHDAVGNEVTVSTEHSVHIDNHAEAVNTIGTVAGDDTVNAHESRMPTFISGAVTGDAQAGDPVIVHVNNVDYNGVVVKGSDGKLHYEVPLPNGALHEGQNNVTVTITGHDGSGNISTAVDHKTVTVDTHANNSVTINDATSDNILNHTELGHHNQTITGVVGGDAQIGDEVTLEINGHYYRGRVEDMHDGKGTLGYKIPVPSTEFGDNKTILNKDVSVKATLVSHDAAGNEAIVVSEHTIHVDNHAYNGVSINTVAGDDVVNAGESKHETLVTGRITGKDAHIGDAVDVTVGKTTVHGTIFADPQGHLYYEAKIPTGVLIEGNNDVTVKVTSHDTAHNEAVAIEHTTITLDTHADATISIHELTAGPVLNHDELSTPKQLITGDVGGDAQVGDKVSIEINGHFYGGNVVDLGNGHLGYQIPVDSSAFGDNQQHLDGDMKIIARVTSHDAAGNEVTATTDHTVHIDNYAEGHITTNPVTGDNIINYDESGQTTTKITGTVSSTATGQIDEGDKVIITVNNQSYETTVIKLPYQHGALGYSVDVPTKDLLADPNPIAHVVAHDAAGNENHFEVTNHIGIDLQADASITIDKVTGDDMINGDESDKEFTKVSGTVGDDVKEGDVVHLVINGNDLTTEVTKDTNGNLVWHKEVSTHDLMVDPHFTATVTATDNANNTATAHADRTVVVDLKVEAVITIDSVTPDNTLNGEELHHKYTLVSGTLTGEMKPGEEVTLKVNGKDYHGTVELDSQGNMVYNVLVDTTDLHQDPNIHASINVIDDALNHKLATADHHVGIDDHANASLTINVVSGDNILNQADQTHPTTTINGTVGGDVHRGDTVHVMVNNTDYAATVEPQTHLNGALGYSVDVNTADLLANGHIDATVSTEDKHGNTITVHTDHDVARDDGAQATISIDTVAGDDWLNNVEAHQDHTTITGKVTGDVHLNDIVDLEVNGQHYYGSVVAQGNGLGYSINVSTDDLLAGGDKPILHASVTGYDDAGNTFLATADHEVAIDTLADVQIKADTANANNNNGPDYYIVTGHVKGDDVHEHDHVLITVGTKTYDTEVIRLSDGKLGFSQNVDDPKYVAAHPDITVQISGTDPHGNPIMATDHIHANVPGYPSGGNTGGTTTTPPHYDPPHAVITISPIAGNDVINKVESEKGTTTIRGTVTGDVHAGEFVTLHIGNQDIPVKVVDRPHLPGELGYEIEVDTKLLMAHPDISVTATAHNGAGDTAAVGVQKTVLVDTHVTAEIHLDNIAGDNVINILESKSGTTTVSGTVNGDGIHNGSNVTIMVDGHPVTTQVFTDSNGVMRFSKDISVNDLRHTPDITVSVTGHDDQGNTFTATDGKTITVDTEVKAEVAIDSVTGDNILNLHETQQATTTITGHVSGDVHPGEHVTLTVNGQVYQNVEIGQDLKYAVDVKTSDLQLGNEIKAEVTGHDDHGNSTTGHATAQYSTDISAAATITTNTVSGDNILSAKDLSADKTQISGTVGGDAAVGDKVTVTLNGVTETADVKLDSLTGKLVYTLEVDTHNLKVQLESQHTDKPEIIVTVTGQDNAGNDFSQDVHKVITIDDHANVTLTFDNVTQDNILNIEESNQPTTQISGTVTGDVKDGGTVILTVNGNERPVTIHGDPTNGFTFKLDVPTSDLLTNQTITYKVTGVDGVGNTLTVNDTNTIAIDHDVKNEVHIATVAGDDKVNIAEHSNPTTMITGTVSGDAQDGDTVTLMLNGKPVVGGDYILHNGQKTFEIAVDNSLLKETDNTLDVTLAGHDTSGNLYTSTDTHTITLDTTIGAHITLNSVATDDVINAAESDHVSVTGTVTPDGDAKLGDEVSVMVNGKTPFVGKVIDLDGQGHLGYDIHVDKGLLQEGKNTFDVSIKATDDAGNEITVHDGHEVQMDTQLAATITLDPVAANNVVNAAAVDHVSVTGMVGTDADAHVGDKVTVTVNGHSFTGVVQDINGHPGYDIPVDKTLLHEGTNTFDVSIDATDKAGNAIIVHAGHDVQVDTQIAASITLDPVAANDVVNAAALDHVSVTGAVSTDSDAKLGDEVTVKVNGHSFTGVVKDINGHPGYDIHVDKGLLHEGDNTVAVSISATDGVGNAITVEASHTVHVDTEINATITIDPVAGDDIINAAEVDNVSVTGTVGTDVDAHVGASVIVTVNGTTFTGAVIDLDGKGHLGYNIPVDKTLLLEGDNTVGVSIDATDSAGNATIVETTHTVHVDTEINASITLDPVGTNDVVNAAAFDHVSVTGAVSTDSDAQLGDKVTVKVNGHSFTGVVQDINGHPGYDIHVDKGLLHEGTNTFDVSIDATDKAGNPITVHTGHDVQVDTQIAATITLNPVAGNDVINASELDHVSVTGAVSTDSDAQLGDSVTVKVNGHSFTGVVQNINGHLGYDIPVDKALLHEGKNTFDVSIDATDKVGNPITVHAGHDVQMDTHADAKITIDKVTGDDHIDSQEARHHVTHITGQIDSADVHNNEHINVTINDKHYDVILHEDNGHLTYDVPVNTNELHIGKNSVGVSVIANDDHGNTNVIHQKADFTMDDPSHRGKHDVDGSDKSHHAANAHSHDNGLSNLFDDSHDTFSFNLAHDSKGHHGDESLKIFTGKENHGNEKVDLSDLAKELHENPDITHMIKAGDAPGGKGDAQHPAHPVHTAGDPSSVMGHDAHDSHGSSHYSMDHLIPKPEHYHS